MLLIRLYYTIKPLVPRSLQIFLRRQVARRKRELFSNIWPVDPETAVLPDGWRGWPKSKNFALLLSHDVETQKGHDNCLKLANLDAKLGFRSYFNFVPERYTNSISIHRDIRNLGCEIGVHGLKHDGKLFSSSRIFNQRAVKINLYLLKWKTRGFTTPSMLCNPDWMKKLNISYSTSTFDYDPFEPQQNPAKTIFPFWVKNSHPLNGYLELPYTLPQDHLLFVILKEKNIDIWKKKLDWIAEKGGLALINTHPDYMNFHNKKLGREEYPVSYYEKFLEYLKEKYGGQYWNPLPLEMVHFWKNTLNHYSE